MSFRTFSRKIYNSIFCFVVKWLVILIAFVLFGLSGATEVLRPVLPPRNAIEVGGTAELRDDVYSFDAGWSVEVAPCSCFSFYADMSYRFVSYQWETMWHDQLHEYVNLQVNGLNESYVGAKYFPVDFFGVALNWLDQPGEGSRVNRFNKLGVEPMLLYRFSKAMLLGLSGQYYTFIEDDNFQPGDELGVKASFVWDVFWNRSDRSGWRVSYAYLFRWRIEESENMNMRKPYRKMDDMYRGFRMRGDVARYFGGLPFPLGMGLGYEMNRGYLFGFETGHRVEFFVWTEFP